MIKDDSSEEYEINEQKRSVCGTYQAYPNANVFY